MADTINVNVADQGFPPPPPGSQALQTPSFVEVEDQPATPASFSIGTATPEAPGVQVASQSLLGPSTPDFIILESGSVQTNNTQGDLVSYTVLVTVVLLAGTTDEQYQVFFTLPAGTSLADLGLSLPGLNALFPAAAAASSPENVPARPIINAGGSWILVPRYNPVSDATMAAPTVGQTVQIAVLRQGTAAAYDVTPNDLNVNAVATPAAAPNVSVQTSTFQGSSTAGSGVVSGFVGTGVRGLPFLGTFEVANQVYGSGLPANVFQ